MIAFQTTFKEGRIPKCIWVDKGKEFYNKHLIDLLGKHSVKMYSTQQRMKRNHVLL